MNFSSSFSRFLLTIVGLLASSNVLLAAGGELPLNAEKLFGPVSNSILMTWIAVGLIVLFCKSATKQMALVPTGFQNFAEWVDRESLQLLR